MALGKAINLGNLNNPQDIARLAHHLKDLYTKVIPQINGNGSPTVPPPQVGAQYLDLTNHKVYVATGVTSSSDWRILN